MSTKTTIKRIALVAVSALGMGLISVIPANAVVATMGSDATVTVGSIVAEPVAAFKIPFTVTTVTAAAMTNDETLGITVSASSTPSGSTFYCSKTSGGTYNAAGCTVATTGYAVKANGTTAADSILVKGTGATAKQHTGWIWVKVSAPGTYTFTVAATATSDGTAAVTATSASTSFVLAAVNSAPTYTNTSTTLAGRVGQQVSIPVTANIAANDLSAVADGQYAVIGTAAAITQQPSVAAGQSAIYPLLTSTAEASAAVAYDKAVTGDGTGSATNTAVQYLAANLSDENMLARTGLTVGTITFTPTAAGIYRLVVWNETSATEVALSGSEASITFTINVTSTAASTVTLSGFGTTSAAAGASGALIKVVLKDASGNIAIPATGETVTLTPSGTGRISKVNDVDVTGSSTAGAAYNLAASAFGQTGTAWVNITNATAEDISVTATISGSSSAAIALSFKTATVTAGNAPTPYNTTATGYTHSGTTTGTTTIPLGAVTTTYRTAGTYDATTTVYHKYLVTDTSGNITGVANLDWDAAAGVGSTGYSSYSVTTTSTTAAQQYTIDNYASGGAQTTTASSAAVSSLTLTPTVNTINATSGGTTTITGVLKDTFGRAAGSTAVTASVAGRNPTTVAQTAVTDALGNFSFTIADANTTSLLTSDTVTLASTAYTTTSKTVTILYGSANAAAKVVLTSDDYTAGVANDSVSAQPIVAATSTTGKAGAEAGAKSVSAKVTNAAGAILAGVPVTFTVSGTGAAILSTKKLVYTDLTGVATTSVYAWKSGTYTVTATAGAVSGTATETFSQSTAAAARIISATANGSVVTAKAEDRFGNPVANVRIYAKIASGSGYFGTGVTTTYADTTVDGTASFVVSGGAASVTVSNISFSSPAGTIVGQTSAAKGYDIGGADAVAFVATVAGTSTVAETGVGNEYAEAGVSSATVDATVSGSSDAIDAANEATDAANAATDAANAAAEAADAATAAAQDAQAAVAELATKVSSLIASIKSQLTSLTNLIIKIQKKVKA